MLGFNQHFKAFKPVAIYDEDGDGVEDNMHMTSDQLDNFYWPNVFGAPIEHMFNTRHGNMPGERNKWFYDKQSEPEDNYAVVKKSWNRKGDKI